MQVQVVSSAWTRGQKQSLVRVTAPRKDAGSGTLMIERKMWTFAPKVNRVSGDALVRLANGG